jgi:ABC-2 type transport system permease protein
LAVVTGAVAWASGGAAALPGWLGWLAPALAWALLWLALCAAVGARARHSGSAAALLVSCWLVLVLLLPSLLNAVVQSFAPPPSALKATMVTRNAEVEADRQRERILGKYVSDRPELNVNTVQDELAWARGYYMQQQFIEQSLAPLRAETRRLRERQVAVRQALSWASPAQLLERALSQSAGTEAERYDVFADQVRAFKRAWDVPLAAPLVQGKSVRRADLAISPHFSFVEPDREGGGLVALWLLGLAALIALADRILRTQWASSELATTTPQEN